MIFKALEISTMGFTIASSQASKSECFHRVNF